MEAIIRVEDIKKTYPVKKQDPVQALKGVSFEIPEGICFGLLGPNGAGKTTAIEIMEGIQAPDSGSVYFKGKSIQSDSSYKEKIGIQFQHSALPEFISVKETLELFSSFYDDPRPQEEIIELCSLQDIIGRDNHKLSGGQRQRMLLALAIISRPEMIFLDEPTTGLDPQARRNFWELIQGIKQENCTVLLTTHYMDEAEVLCDKIAIIDHGQIIRLDTPEKLLTDNFDGVLVRMPWSENFTSEQAQAIFGKLTDGNAKNNEGKNTATFTDEGIEIVTPTIDATIKQLLQAQVHIDSLSIHKPNLEDLFIKLTGTSLRT